MPLRVSVAKPSPDRKPKPQGRVPRPSPIRVHAPTRPSPTHVAAYVAAMERLKRRTDFRAAAQAKRAPAGAFVLQARARGDGGAVRVGFTVSRQVGNAVERNRVRRRLREVVRLAPAAALHAGHDYVLIGRRPALAAPFGDLVRQFDTALRRVHDTDRDGHGAAGPGGPAATGSNAAAPLHKAGSSPARRGDRRKPGPLRRGPSRRERKST